MPSWGTVDPTAPKFTYGRKEDTPWNWDLNWKDYCKREKGYAKQWDQARRELARDEAMADDLYASGKLDFAQKATGKSYHRGMRTVFGVAGSFISEPAPPPPPLRARSGFSSGRSTARTDIGKLVGVGGGGTFGGVSARSRAMSTRRSRGGAGGASSRRTGRSQASGRVGSPATMRTGRSIAGGSTTRSERRRFEDLAARYAAETERRQRVESRLVELEDQLAELHGKMDKTVGRQDFLKSTHMG